MKTMPFPEYAAIDAINWSTLKEMARSPAHYKHRVDNARADTHRLAEGRAVHTLLLEPDRFARDYAVFEGERRAGKVWEAFADANAGRTILKVAEYERCLAIRDSVKRNPLAAKYLAVGKAEVVLTWTDEATGLSCKARVDWLCTVDGVTFLIDVKTSADIEMRRFGNIAVRFGYHAQLAFYLRGLRANGALAVSSEARILAVEAEAPHDAGVFVVDDDTLYAGDAEVSALLARVKVCRETDAWPGQYEGETPLEMPRWWYAEEEAELGVEIGRAA